MTYLVDTSVWIDFLRQRSSNAVKIFISALDEKISFGLTGTHIKITNVFKKSAHKSKPLLESSHHLQIYQLISQDRIVA